ncbi:hypothetical protein WJX84_011070 [Apatococcus fuscideae]|uniref:AP2/ERF domain-containing protein n=1 Tax=Apatococcus fuscideae TaxID=2026836 RepID=A0AAW1TFR8_9CHLO
MSLTGSRLSDPEAADAERDTGKNSAEAEAPSPPSHPGSSLQLSSAIENGTQPGWQAEPDIQAHSSMVSLGFGTFSAAKLQAGASSFHARPGIFQRRPPQAKDIVEELGVKVPEWDHIRAAQDTVQLRSRLPEPFALDKVIKASKSKGLPSGRTYTSKFRGVHQTFPTKRWEAQFRRSGKPTSLGCFDHEEEAARAYDKMMLWCELHHTSGMKGGITNFDPSEYEKDLAWLHTVSQEELVQALRSDGRRQAAQRMLRQKRDGQTPGSPLRESDPPASRELAPAIRIAKRPQCAVFYTKCDELASNSSTPPDKLAFDYFAPACSSQFCSGPGASQSSAARLQPGGICGACVLQGYEREEQCIEEYTNCVAENLPGNTAACVSIAQTFVDFLCGPVQDLAPAPGPLPAADDSAAGAAIAAPELILPLPGILPEILPIGVIDSNLSNLVPALNYTIGGKLYSPSPDTGALAPLSSSLSPIVVPVGRHLLAEPETDEDTASGAFTLSKLPLGLGGRRLLAAGPCGGVAAPGPEPDEVPEGPSDAPEAPAPAPGVAFPLADAADLELLPISLQGNELSKLLPNLDDYTKGVTLRPPVPSTGVATSAPVGRRLLTVDQTEPGPAPDQTA